MAHGDMLCLPLPNFTSLSACFGFLSLWTRNRNKDFLKAIYCKAPLRLVLIIGRRIIESVLKPAPVPCPVYIPSTSLPHMATSSSISRTGMDRESWKDPAWPFVMTILSQYFLLTLSTFIEFYVLKNCC